MSSSKKDQNTGRNEENNEVQNKANRTERSGGKTTQNDGFRYDYDDSSDL
ncbi:hypothetical protein [Alkalihalobacterium alkalinitrilicum]|nr:hypothetical protein [Alkalihalobacterium alkalinitrilicum]